MFTKKFPFYLSIFLVLSTFQVAVGSPAKKDDLSVNQSRQINRNLHNKSDFPEPPVGRPNSGNAGGGTRLTDDGPDPGSEGRPTGRNAGGGTRGGCPQDANESPDLTLLIPANQQGLTVAEYPTFFAFVPQNKTRIGEFILYDKTDKKLIYRTTLQLSDTPGIVSVKLPGNQPPLKIGNNYEWRFSLHCKATDDRSEDLIKIGRIKRVELSAAIGKIQSNTNPLEKARIYQENNIWYDALQTLAELNSTTASNSNIVTIWQQLLKSEPNLKEIAAYPLLDCCKPNN